MFYCNYCGTSHSKKFQSEEHIIPKGLLNRNYTLKDVCKGKNQFLSHSFETEFTSITEISEILKAIKFWNSKKHAFLYNFVSESGEIEHAWIQGNQLKLKDPPKYITTNKATISLPNKKGEVITTEIDVGFEFISEIRGDKDFLPLAKVENKAKQDLQRLEEYGKRLLKNPEINPDFHKFLIENDIDWNIKLAVQSESQAVPRPAQVITANLEFKSNWEIWARQMLKIAWTHACKIFGVTNISNPISQAVLSNIFSGNIEKEVVTLIKSEVGQEIYDSLFRKHVIAEANDGEDEVYFWRETLMDTDDIYQKIKKSLDRSNYYLESLMNFRKRDLRHMEKLVVFKRTGILQPDEYERIPEFKFHKLTFENFLLNSMHPMMLCHIKLFGGIIEATVQVTNVHLEIPPNSIETIIEF